MSALPCLRLAPIDQMFYSCRDTLRTCLRNYRKFPRLLLANFRRRQGGCAEKLVPRSYDNTVQRRHLQRLRFASVVAVVVVMRHFFLYLGQMTNGRDFLSTLMEGGKRSRTRVCGYSIFCIYVLLYRLENSHHA